MILEMKPPKPLPTVDMRIEESYMIPHIRNVKRESMKWKKGNKKSIKCLGLSGQDQDSVGKSPGGS